MSVRYYLGTYGSPASTQRVNYYDSQGVPNLWFDGGSHMLGAGADAATGDGYMNIIRSHSYDASPIRIDIDTFNPSTGAVGATVTMYSTTASLNSEDFHILLYEDDVNTTPATYDETHLARDIYSTSISLTGAGNTLVFNHTFTIDPGWDTTKLRVVAFVQLTDSTIIQAGTKDPVPDFRIRGMVPFSRNTIGPSTGIHETGDVTVMNVGLGETFEISAVIDEAPAGWTVAFKDNVGTTHTGPLSFALGQEASTTFGVIAVPNSPGYMRYSLVVTSPNLLKPLVIPFVYTTDDVDVLVVDDDGGEDYEHYFTAALGSAGKTAGVWDRGSGPLTQEVRETFDVLVWNVGRAFPTLDADDQAFLTGFLDDGKGLFLSGQDIGWELHQGNPAIVWYRSHLHAVWVRGDTNIMDVVGVVGDELTDGMDLRITGGDGADNQSSPDEISDNYPDGTTILFYEDPSDSYGAAVRSIDSDSGARVIYLGFGFEAIDNAQDRRDLLGPAVSWLKTSIFRDGFESGDLSSWN